MSDLWKCYPRIPVSSQRLKTDSLTFGKMLLLGNTHGKKNMLLGTFAKWGSAGRKVAIKADISHWQHSVLLSLCWQAPLPLLCLMLILPQMAGKAQQLVESKRNNMQELKLLETALATGSLLPWSWLWPSESRVTWQGCPYHSIFICMYTK